MQNIQELQNQIEFLKKENQYLKSLLNSAGIHYEAFPNMENNDLYDPDQDFLGKEDGEGSLMLRKGSLIQNRSSR